MKIHDISVPLQDGGLVFPGDPETRIKPFLRKEKGDLANVSLLSMGSHSGTHIDPPLHLWDDGSGADNVGLDFLVGEARVVELTVEKRITAEDMVNALTETGVERLLLKTRNSALWAAQAFSEDFVCLTPEAAKWLAEYGVKLIGFDYLSLEDFAASSLEAHEFLLKAGIVIVEGLDLSKVAPGEYQLVCLPLKIENGDGAPARAILIEK